MSEHTVKTRSGPVRHPDITRDLLGGITSGRFPVGSLLPTELELCDTYRTSRHTVRAAINELVELGLVSRRKSVGTRVEADIAPSQYRQSLTSLADLMQFGTARLRVVQDCGTEVLDGTLAEALGCATGTRWLRISSLRLDGRSGGAPVGWTDVYIDPAYNDVPDLARAEPDTLVAALIETRHGRPVAEIQQDIAATEVPGRLAVPLQVEPGSPAMRIVRRYFDPVGDLFEVSDSIHPAGRFTASSRLKRGP